MSLTSALSIAQSALLNTSRQTSVISRNVSEASNPDYTRRNAILTTASNGAKVAQIQRATSDILFRQNLSALSGWSAQSTLSKEMNTLALAVNGAENTLSAAALLGRFQEALQTFAAAPSNGTVAENTIEAARQLANGLNSQSSQIQAFRGNMDAQIKTGVEDVNRLLSDFEKVNREIVAGTRTGRDVNDALDQRDALLKKISEYVPVSAISRADNDMSLTTASGAVLFDVVPREVTFQPTSMHAAGVAGSGILIDGVPLSPGSGGSTSASGKLAAMLQLRDDVAGGMQAQLDEVARGLITTFAETGPPDLAGLFTWPGGPALPASGTLVNGLAGSISINAAFDSAAGGNPNLLRDGGANGAAYVVNTNGGASFSGLLLTLQERLETPMGFDPAAGISGSASLSAYSTNAIGWFEGIRQEASNAAENKSALFMRTDAALSNEVGVNIDEELILLLQLEQTYEASARLMAAIDQMMRTLLDAVR